jgi:hypothetical protein
VHLLRRDIVDGDDENGSVLLEQALELVEVARLVTSLAPHIFLLNEGRIFQGKGVYFEMEIVCVNGVVASQVLRGPEISYFIL